MLTVLIYHKQHVVYLHAFKDNQKAIDHYVEMQVFGHFPNDAVLAITNDTEIPLGPVKEKTKPYYIS